MGFRWFSFGLASGFFFGATTVLVFENLRSVLLGLKLRQGSCSKVNTASCEVYAFFFGAESKKFLEIYDLDI